MSVREWRELNIEELNRAIGQAELDLAVKHEEVMNGKEKDHSQLIRMRRDIARMNTVRVEKGKVN